MEPRGESYYEDLEMEGPVEESFLPTRPAPSSIRDRRQEIPQVSLLTFSKGVVHRLHTAQPPFIVLFLR